MEYSTTQATNITAIAGVTVLVLNHFHVNIGTDDISAIIGAGLTIIGIIMNWVHRYQKGDLTVGGFRK